MELLLDSYEFTFERAEACLVADDWEEQLEFGAPTPSLVGLEAGRIATAGIDRPGAYLLLCSGLSVTRKSDRRPFFVPLFVPREPVQISKADLTTGSLLIRMEPEGVYALTFFDFHSHWPRVNETIRLSLDPWRGRHAQGFPLSVQVRTNESGTITFLGEPTLYDLHVHGDTLMAVGPR